jgi:hypothetical protein
MKRFRSLRWRLLALVELAILLAMVVLAWASPRWSGAPTWAIWRSS